jgi:hypothetical protein
VGVRFQPSLAALLVLAQLPLPVIGPVDLLGRDRHPTRHPGGLLAAAAQPAKHAGRWAAAGLLEGGQGGLSLLAVGSSPGEFTAAVAGSLVELAAQPVPLGPQLRRALPPQVQAAGGVDGQGLTASPGQGLGQLQVAVGLVPIGQVKFAGPLGFGPTTAYSRVSWRARDSCTYSQLTSSLPVSRTRARPRVSPWARWPVVA